MYKLSNNYRKFVDYSTMENPVIDAVECVLLLDDTTTQNLNTVLPAESEIRTIKNEALEYLIAYAVFILKDDVITEEELFDFTALKRVFRIDEGDFIKFKSVEVLEILKQQFLRMYSDHIIDRKEAIKRSLLLEIFNINFNTFIIL